MATRRLLEAIALGSFGIDPKAIALTEVDKPKSWVQVGKTGKGFKHAIFGEFDITEKMLGEMEANGKIASKASEVPLDYNHLSFGAKSPDQAIAAGWFEDFERRDSGQTLWGHARWTPKAAAHIAAEEFRYISPLFFFNSEDEHGNEVGARLVSAALTIYPFLKGMAGVTLSELHRRGMVQLIDESNLSFDERRSRVYAAVYAKFENSTTYTFPEDCFDDKVVVQRGGKKFTIPYSFNTDGSVKLGDELTEVVNTYQPIASLNEGNAAMSDKNITVEDVIKHPEFVKLQESSNAIKGILDTLQTSLKTSNENVTQLTEQLQTERATTAVDKLVAAGKLLPAQKEKWMKLFKADHATFVELSEGLQVVVKLNRTQGADSTGSQNELNANDEDYVAELEGGKDPVALMETKVNAYIAANGGPDKCRVGDATKAVANANPKLFEHYRASFVKAGSGNMNNVQ